MFKHFHQCYLIFILMYHSLPPKGKKKLIILDQCSPKPTSFTPVPIPFTRYNLKMIGIQGFSFNEVILSGKKKKIPSK